MPDKSLRSRLALGAAVFALLLKAAVPMFASAAAHLQGKSVADICTVYGVALPAAHDHDHAAHAEHAQHAAQADHSSHHGSHSGAAHTGDHCALTALAALAAHEPQPMVVPSPHLQRATSVPHYFASIADACALWAARLRHGPPALA